MKPLMRVKACPGMRPDVRRKLWSPDAGRETNRDGQFKAEVFEIANRLLLDPDDMVQKGYGWMLKSLADPFEDEVYSFILDHRASMPRTALRYAIEKMPVEKKREIGRAHV